jgi:aminodeoxychorismate synthase, component I, bacterial clade
MSRRHSLPAEVYALVEHTPSTVLLECGKATGGANEPNHTQLFVEPLRICTASSPDEVAALFVEIESAVASGLTAAGYFTHECGNCFEPKAGLHPLPAGQPLAWFGIYEHGYRFDHATGSFEDDEPVQLARFRDGVARQSDVLSVDVQFSLTEAQYAGRIEAIHEWIRAGDVYQLNFTAPYRVKVRGNMAALYAQLSARQPVEYGAFIHAQPERRILSLSPELFFRIDEVRGSRRITTRPMKGTAARGRTTAEDRALAEWLRDDGKNRAENLMIVDLLRNDLGRLAKFGTVRAEEMFFVERYATLWQMTSTVTADLRPGVGYSDVFRALFPCGSITGAPKVRAMQLLAELEEQPRGVYTGAIGYFSPKRTVFNVAIRTLELCGNEGTMGVGSGIVIDSVASDEFNECQLKAQFLTSGASPSPEGATPCDDLSLIETMLWDGGFLLIELHLDRLVDSAEYLGFPCRRADVQSALQAHAQGFRNSAFRKVRLLLNKHGELSIASETISPQNSDAIVRVRIADDRADSADRWLYHKTTQHALYDKARSWTTGNNCDELLFLNERGEVTEGAISNVFIEKDGCMFTPPVRCGLLPGVYRRHLLETRPNTEERVLTLENLRTADAVYVCNAVRGLRKASIEWR